MFPLRGQLLLLSRQGYIESLSTIEQWCRVVSMDCYETIWIKKEEPDEVPNESGSMETKKRDTFTEDPLDLIKEEQGVILKEDETKNIFTEDPLDLIKKEHEVILEEDETKNIVVSSAIHETDSTRLIRNGESCGISVEEPFNQGVVREELEKVTQESRRGTRTQALTSQEYAAFRTGLKCSLRKKEFQKFNCSSCLQSFPSKYRLIMHVFIHIDDVQPPAYVCKSCGEVFASNDCLSKHLEISESHKDLFDGDSGEFDCGDDHKNILEADDVLVEEETEKQSSLIKNGKIAEISFNGMCNTHTMSHGRQTRYRRGNYTTLSTTSTVQAVQLTAPKLHKCDICDKFFVWLHALKRHKVTHTRVKHHKCDVCGKTFSQLPSPNKHATGHTGVKPHKCEICIKSDSQWKVRKGLKHY